jgi:hypothetical protein
LGVWICRAQRGIELLRRSIDQGDRSSRHKQDLQLARAPMPKCISQNVAAASFARACSGFCMAPRRYQLRTCRPITASHSAAACAHACLLAAVRAAQRSAGQRRAAQQHCPCGLREGTKKTGRTCSSTGRHRRAVPSAATVVGMDRAALCGMPSGGLFNVAGKVDPEAVAQCDRRVLPGGRYLLPRNSHAHHAHARTRLFARTHERTRGRAHACTGTHGYVRATHAKPHRRARTQTHAHARTYAATMCASTVSAVYGHVVGAAAMLYW